MNPTLHQPCELQAVSADCPTDLAHDELFELRMRYRPEGSWQVFLAVFVPKELQSVLTGGQVHAVHLETLEINGPTSRALPGIAGYLVLGVHTNDGQMTGFVPEQLSRARARLIVPALACMVTGAAAVFLGPAWLAASALVAGTHLLRTASSIPHRPFCTLRQQA